MRHLISKPVIWDWWFSLWTSMVATGAVVTGFEMAVGFICARIALASSAAELADDAGFSSVVSFSLAKFSAWTSVVGWARIA